MLIRPPCWCRTLPLLLVAIPALAAAEPFVFVSLPDTQIYADDRQTSDTSTPAITDPRGTGAIFFDQTEWIVDHAAERSIRYVQHLGDIVQNGNDRTEWELSRDAMRLLLDADIPHGTVMGNHDDNDSDHGPTYRSNYLEFFGPPVFEDRPWYTASSPAGGANFQLLEHEGVKLGFLNFSIDHPQAEIDWATGVVTDHPDTIFIIGTHRYMWDLKLAAGRFGEDVTTIFGTFNVPANPVNAVEEPNDAEELFQEFVTQHPNVLMIHAGHFHSDYLRLDGQNSAGQTIVQMLTDYQNGRNGGDGYLRLYELDFDQGTLNFETWSPTLDRSRTTIDHFVESIHLAWDQRDSVADELGVSEEIYLALLDVLFKDTPSPDGFLLQHPDFDTEEERAYYDQLLLDMFGGEIVPGFENILDWEGLWIQGFAANPNDVFDFSPSVRSPNGSLPFDFSQYYTASPEQLLERAFDKLLVALAGVPDDDFLRAGARARLIKAVGLTRRQAERGRYKRATLILATNVVRHTDGCARGDKPDSRPPDWIQTCESQALVAPTVAELLELLAGFDEEPKGVVASAP